MGEDLHEIGIRMVADFLAIDGWDVHYPGADTPAVSIIEEVEDRKAGFIALSITMPSRLAALRYLIRSLRADAETKSVRIIGGGYPFLLVPGLWKALGADAAPCPEEAVAAAWRLTI